MQMITINFRISLCIILLLLIAVSLVPVHYSHINVFQNVFNEPL